MYSVFIDVLSEPMTSKSITVHTREICSKHSWSLGSNAPLIHRQHEYLDRVREFWSATTQYSCAANRPINDKKLGEFNTSLLHWEKASLSLIIVSNSGFILFSFKYCLQNFVTTVNALRKPMKEYWSTFITQVVFSSTSIDSFISLKADALSSAIFICKNFLDIVFCRRDNKSSAIRMLSRLLKLWSKWLTAQLTVPRICVLLPRSIFRNLVPMYHANDKICTTFPYITTNFLEIPLSCALRSTLSTFRQRMNKVAISPFCSLKYAWRSPRMLLVSICSCISSCKNVYVLCFTSGK